MAPNRSENPVVLSRIYTRTGDDGTTALGDGSRTVKTDSRVAAYADVDGGHSASGKAIACAGQRPGTVAGLTGVKKEVSDGAPHRPTREIEAPPYPPLRIDSA